MSVSQELEKVNAKLETATLKIEQLESGATASQETIDAQAVTIAEQTVQIDGHAAAVETLNVDHTAATQELTDANAALTTENAQMKEKLKNPAFKAAGIEGEDPEAAGGGGEGGDAGSGVLADYAALSGSAKIRFFRENKAELLAASVG